MTIMTYISASVANKPRKKTTGNKNRKNKRKGNKSKEVQSWNEWEASMKKPECGSWIAGTIPMRDIKKMKWGDIDDLTDEEFGYYT